MKFRPYYLILAVATLMLVCSTTSSAVTPTGLIVSKVEPIAQMEAAPDAKRKVIELLYQQGTELLNSGEFQAALDTFKEVLKTVQDFSDDYARLAKAGTLNQIAYAYYHLGEYEKALASSQEALNIYIQQEQKQEQGAILTNIGVLYGEVGQYQKALESHQQAFAIAQQLNDLKKQGEILNNMGAIHKKLNQNQEALNLYKQALEILEQFQDVGWKATILTNIGLNYAELEQYQKAIDSYQQALTFAEQDSNRITEGRIYNNLGLVYSKLGESQRALDSLQKALVIRQDLKDLPGEHTTQNDIGTVYRDSGEYEIALRYYEKALEIARTIQARPKEGETLSNIGLTLLKSGQEVEATNQLFQAVEIWESLHPGLSDENKVSLMDSQADTYRWLQQALIAQNQIEAALEVSERGRARAFIELLASRFNQSDVSPPPLKFEQIQEIARQQNSTLVEYSIVSEGELLYIWVISPEGSVAFRTVDMSSFSITSRNLFHPRAYYRMLIEPIADLLPNNPDSNVIFIPHQQFFLVPFAALQNEQGSYLIEKHTILIAPSIQVLDLTYQHQKSLVKPEKPKTVVIGNPKMPSIASQLGEQPQPLSSLPGTEREALAIAKMLKTEAIIGDLATEETVVKQMNDADIIHLATHGLLNELKHLGLKIPGALALTPTANSDGLLTSDEIFNIKLKAEMVVLSACNTGRGKITEDGVIGLSRAFISAGVPSVIVSLWYIPDNPSADLMIEFYRQMQTTSDKAYALRQAMIETMKKHPRPLEWAGFLLIGQPGVQ
ncbi:CHAT domain-containing protein [Capilliphycus salinus ALCB114379]|uniref:CHAT domain-containing protein n=1 Tax=Capilliphycus salinus TaxID=2768948 RepID=UPI0039A61318